AVSVSRPVWQGVTWRRLLTAQAVSFGIAVLVWNGDNYDSRDSVPHTWIVVHFMLWATSALFIVPATLRADDAVAVGARPLWAYRRGMTIALLTALATTATLACLALGYGRLWFHPQNLPMVAISALYVKELMDLCFAGGLALLCRVNQHLARQIALSIERAE